MAEGGTAPLRVAMLLHKPVRNDSRVRREAEALAAAGHLVTVIQLAEDDGGGRLPFGLASAVPARWARALPRPAARAAMLATFVLRLRELRPDVIHAHDAAMLLPALAGRRLTGARILYDSHELASSVPYRERYWEQVVVTLERLAFPRCAAVITVSGGIAERLQERYGLARRPAVLRNVSALAAGEGGNGAPPPAARRALVLHQGAAATGRGGEQLVRAMAQVPEADLLFLGDGEPRYVGRLRALVEELGLGDRVRFEPSVPLEQLLARTRQADVGVSLLEPTCENHRLALPNKVFEYVAAEVPVVVSDLPELRGLVAEHGIGTTADPDRPEEIAAAIRAALAMRDDPALPERLARARSRLSWENEREVLLGVYAELSDRRRARTAVSIVRNAATHDARVLRAGRALAGEGFATTILASDPGDGRDHPDHLGGIPVRRLAGAARLRGLLRRTRGAGPPAPPPTPTAAAGPAAPSPPGGMSLTGRLTRIAAGAGFTAQAAWEVLRRRPELVICNDHNTMWVGLAARLLTSAAVVYDAHELWADRNGRWEWRPGVLAAEWLFVRAAHRTITASPGYSGELARRYRIAAPAVVRNVPDLAPPSRRPRHNGETPLLVYLGGLMPHRGLEEALALAAARPVRLRLIGPGRPAFVAGLRERAEALGVADRVEVAPPVPADEVLDAIAGADAGLCLIQPACRSYELTLPNKLFEYVLAGVPVLATDLPVIGAFVAEHDVGERAAPGDPAGLVAALDRLLDPARRTALHEALAVAATRLRWDDDRRVLLTACEAALSAARA